MLFNSLNFAIFFVLVYGLYLLLNHKWQNRMLLLASYVFYAAWDWRFLSLIFISTILDYCCGLRIYKSTAAKTRKFYLILSICGNLSILGFFKYFNFFSANLQALLNVLGFHVNSVALNIILPVGISFYTFQTLSYTIDIYKNELKPTKSLRDFALFVAFFPQLVAGPIERAAHLFPQVLNPRKLRLDWFCEGCYLISWGLFQKVFVADNLARLVDPVFSAGPPYGGVKVLLALYAFAFQIYADFAGYSNIARGLGKCMGFDIMINFNLPYFATNPQEFWRRWHISLSSWLHDYLYLPIVSFRGSRTRRKTVFAVIITFLLCGLWHGAAWNFVFWGMFWGFILIAYIFIKPYLAKIPVPYGNNARKFLFGIKVIFFFHIVCLGWLIFRSQDLRQAYFMFNALLSGFYISPEVVIMFIRVLFFTVFLIILQIFQFYTNDLLIIRKFHPFLRACVYLIIFYSIVIFGVNNAQNFIYFQF